MVLWLWLACQDPMPEPAPPGLSHIELRTAGAGDDAPVIMAIHGLGDQPHRFQRLFESFPLPARILVPAGPIPHGEGHAWFLARPGESAAFVDGLRSATEQVAQLAATVEQPVIVTGFSQGGMVSFAMASQHPEHTAAAIPIGGTLPSALWPTSPSQASTPVVTALHGAADERVPIGPTQEATAALSGQSMDAILLRYPGIGHTISPQQQLDLYLALADAMGRTLPNVAHCALLTPAPAQNEHAVTLLTAAGERSLPENSLLRETTARCGTDMHAVEVLSVNPFIRLPDAPDVHTTGCVHASDLQPLDDHVLLSNTERISTTMSWQTVCGSRRFNRHPLATLTNSQSATPAMLDAVDAVMAHWPAELGPPPPMGVSSSGRVLLPLPTILSADMLEEERRRERLETPLQQEKITTALGPMVDGEPLYTHFSGTDALYSDAWGSPALISALLSLAWQWRPVCLQAGGTPRTCTVQFSDLAWLHPKRPDPLGHRTHYSGRCVDIRLFRDDGSRYEAWWNRPDDRVGVSDGYSATLTAAFLQHALQHHPFSLAYFNDPNINVPNVQFHPGHDDHIHLCLPDED